MQINEKLLCLTIDVEPDFGGLTKTTRYYGKDHLIRLKDLLYKFNLKLTAFVTGKTLEENPEIYDLLCSMNAEIEQHSYAHRADHDLKIDDIEKGILTHKRITGMLPMGYRAPQGLITKSEVQCLESLNIKFDSSIFPTLFPGRFNNTHFPQHPFIIKGTKLMEIPFSVIPYIKIPIGLSYMQLLGFSWFKTFFKIFGIPPLIVFDFHTYELGRVRSYDELPMSLKIGYYRSQRLYNDPINVLEKFISFITQKGYTSITLSDVYNRFYNIAPTWEWFD